MLFWHVWIHHLPTGRTGFTVTFPEWVAQTNKPVKAGQGLFFFVDKDVLTFHTGTTDVRCQVRFLAFRLRCLAFRLRCLGGNSCPSLFHLVWLDVFCGSGGLVGLCNINITLGKQFLFNLLIKPNKT